MVERERGLIRRIDGKQFVRQKSQRYSKEKGLADYSGKAFASPESGVTLICMVASQGLEPRTKGL